jgi:hypothetical protein
MTTYNQLCEKLPSEAVQHVSRDQSKKSYDTTGYGYQWLVDRLNQVCGIDGWGYDWTIIKEYEGTWGQYDTPFFDITVSVKIWIGSREIYREHAGGHRGAFYGDTLKGAISNAIKKTAAMFGLGADAFRGELDDDHAPIEQGNTQKPLAGNKNSENIKNGNRVDFDEVRETIAPMSVQEMRKYFKELKAREMSEKQLAALERIFIFEAEKKSSQDIQWGGEM